MSINWLSDHLCLVLVIIIGLLVVSSTFQSACATTDSNDFSESRQFKKNLAVSKYRNNTHWLPNYTWKPPEKFHGPRKRPAWEVDQVAESETKTKEREEREEWENMMREVTRREREKWKTWKINEQSQPVPSTQLPMLSADILKRNIGSTESSLSSNDELKNQQDGSIGLNSYLPNSQSVIGEGNPADEGFSKDPPKTFDDNLMKPSNEETALEATFPSGRWGMSVKNVPKEFLNEISGRLAVQRSNDSSKQDEDQTIRKNQWKNEKDATTLGSSGKTIGNESLAGNSTISGQSIRLRNFEKQQTLPTKFPNGRWGISVKEPPKEFLKEMSRRSRNFAISSKLSEQDEARRRAGERKFHTVEENRGKKGNTGTERASMKLSNGFATGRWGMSESSPSREFLREISRRGHAGIARFHKPGTLSQLVAGTIPINDPQSRKLTFFRTPSLSNVLIIQKFPGLLGVSMFPRYLMNPRILGTLKRFNFPMIRCMICRY